MSSVGMCVGVPVDRMCGRRSVRVRVPSIFHLPFFVHRCGCCALSLPLSAACPAIPLHAMHSHTNERTDRLYTQISTHQRTSCSHSPRFPVFPLPSYLNHPASAGYMLAVELQPHTHICTHTCTHMHRAMDGERGKNKARVVGVRVGVGALWVPVCLHLSVHRPLCLSVVPFCVCCECRTSESAQGKSRS